MNCSHCGASLKGDTQFCSSCGQKIKEDPSNYKNLSGNEKGIHQTKSYRKIVLISTLGFLALIICIYIGFLSIAPQDHLIKEEENVSNEQFQSLNEDYWNSEVLDVDNEDFSPLKSLTTQDNTSSHAREELIAQNPEFEEILATVEGQLKALYQNDLNRAYYEYTSKDFKKTSTFEHFQQATKEYLPMIEQKQIYFDYPKININNERANVSLYIEGNKNTIFLENLLIKENNKWKIWGSQIKEADAFVTSDINQSLDIAEVSKSELNVEKLPSDDSSSVIEVVKGQLNQLLLQDISKAYYDYSSPEFQQATSFSAFQQFINGYPILSQYTKVFFSDVSLENNKANIVAILQDFKTSNPIEYTLVKTDGQWKVYGFRVLAAESSLQKLSSSDKGEIISIITGQLSDLRKDQIEQAYNYASKEFKKATSLQDFKDFIKTYPIFKDNKSTSYGEATIEHQGVLIPVTLNSNQGIAEVEYRLTKEDKQWKLWSMNLQHYTPVAERPQSIKSADLLQVIESQLKDIRDNNITRAYEEHTSKEFKAATPLFAFEQFVLKNPVMSKNKSADFKNLSFENDIGIYEGTLTSSDDEIEVVKYRMVYEDKRWKILSINIEYTPLQPPKVLEFSKVVIGTDVNLEGLVTHPLTEIKTDQGKITANIFLHNGNIGDQVEVVLEHIETASKIPPVSAVPDQPGDAIVSFVFTPPTQGWPRGNYKLSINSSTEAKTSFNFKVD